MLGLRGSARLNEVLGEGAANPISRPSFWEAPLRGRGVGGDYHTETQMGTRNGL